MIKLIKTLRQERRIVKTSLELARTYHTYIDRLKNKNGRKFVLAEVNKTKNKMNSTYKNRVYTPEEMNEILGIK